MPRDDEPESFDLRLPIRLPDGSRSNVDIRTLSFVRFEDNEAHSQLYGINLGEWVRGVGPDERHPFVLRNSLLWNNFWAFRPVSPSVLVDGMDVYNGRYGLYRPVYDHHAYLGLTIAQVENPQAFSVGETPRGFAVPGPAPREVLRAPEIAKKAATPANLGPFIMNPLLTTPGYADVKAASAAFPAPLEPVDDLPPATVITSATNTQPGMLTVRGTTSDSGAVKRVVVNGKEARPLRPNFAEWEVVIEASEGGAELSASAEDAAGNVEPRPHKITR
jgi:hypothetical protein